MTAAVAIVQVTSRNVLGLKRLLGFGVLALFPGVIFLLTSRQATDFGKAENFTGTSLFAFLALVVPIVSIVIAGSVLGTERRGNTLSFLMLRPLSRFSIAAAKLGSAIVASFAICAIGAALLGVAGSLALDDFGYLTGLLLATLIGIVGYASIFMPIGYLTERATLAGFLFLFVWESAIAAIIPGLSGTSVWRIAVSAWVALSPERLDPDILEAGLGDLAPGAGGAIVKVIVLAGLSIAITGWLLRSRDLT